MTLLIALSAAILYYFPLHLQGAVLFLFSITSVSLCRAVLTWCYESRRMRVFNFAIHALCIGAVIGFTAGFPVAFRLGMTEERITGLYGTVLTDTRLLADGKGMLSFSVSKSLGLDGVSTSACGKVEVIFPDYFASHLKEAGRGAQAFIEGRFIKDADGLFFAPSIYITTPASALNQRRTAIRMKLVKCFSDSSWGGLYLALILGMKDNLDEKLSKNYQKAGCSHVLSLSGMHLSLIIALLSLLLKKALGLKLSALLGVILIICYVYLVGDLPSLNRAAIMYVLVTYTVINNLPKRASAFLSISFIIQIVMDRQSGMSISFILSYGALAGILLFGPALCNILKGLIPAKIASPFSASLGAFIATAAITANVFGVLYPVGIIAGLVIVPLTEIFIIFSFVFLILCPFPALSGTVFLVLELLYRSLEAVVSFFAQAPCIPVQSTKTVAACSFALGAFILLLNAKKQGRFHVFKA